MNKTRDLAITGMATLGDTAAKSANRQPSREAWQPMTKPRYQLLLEVQHQADDPDGTRRLRMLLKRMLRSFGLRCITATPVDEQPNVKEQTNAN